MGHAHANLLHPIPRTFLQQPVEDHHQSLRALQGEALLPDITGVEKYLERLGFEQGTKQRNLGFPRDRRLANARFQAMSHPVADTRVLNVLKLSSD